MTSRRITLALLVMLGLELRALAAIQSYEGFDYPNTGSNLLADANGGTGWDGPWRYFGTLAATTSTNHHRLSQDDISLDSNAFPFTPIGDRVVSVGVGPGNNTWADRSLTNAFDLSAEGNVRYFSFLFQKNAGASTGGDNMEFNLWSAGVADPITQVRIGSTSAEQFFLYHGANVPASANFDTGVAFNQTYFMVLKLESHATTNDMFSAMTFSATDTVPTEEPTTWEKVHSVGLGAVLSGVRLWIGNGTTTPASGQFDEIRIGETWADVAVGDVLTNTGDFDIDGDVDGADFLAWQRGVGIESGAARQQGDANGDGAVNSADLVIWRDEFGDINSGGVPIPEPAAAPMALAAIAAVARLLRSNRPRKAGLGERSMTSSINPFSDPGLERE